MVWRLQRKRKKKRKTSSRELVWLGKRVIDHDSPEVLGAQYCASTRAAMRD